MILECAWCESPMEYWGEDDIVLCDRCGEITQYDGSKLPDRKLDMLMQPEWRKLYLKWQQMQSHKQSRSSAT
jgi:hypothetical protein